MFFIFIGFSVLSKSEKVNIELLPTVSASDIIIPTINGSINEEAPIPPQCYTKTESSNSSFGIQNKQ
jgi:hypothetical protein